jgi:hypothetical protein
MENIERIERLVRLQSLYNREKEIRDLYHEEEKKLERFVSENALMGNSKNDLEINIQEMSRKINEEVGRRDDINKRINSLNDGKDKIKIARQIKSWEKEMERQQQELSLIQAQIDYDMSKNAELRNEHEKVTVRYDENSKKISDLEAQINKIKDEHRDELSDIDSGMKNIHEDFDVQFIEYFEALLRKTNGTAIVEIDDEACLGCYTVLPTNLQGELGTELPTKDIELHQCPHCFRYLYYRNWLTR